MTINNLKIVLTFQIGNWYTKTIIVDSQPIRSANNACIEFSYSKNLPLKSEPESQEETLISNLTLSVGSIVTFVDYAKLSRNDLQKAIWTNEESNTF